MDFAILADHRAKLKESEKKDKHQDLTRELKKTMEHESDCGTNCNWCTQHNHQRIDKETGGLRNQMTSGDHPKSSIIKIGQNTKSPGNVRRLTITQTPVKNSQKKKK